MGAFENMGAELSELMKMPRSMETVEFLVLWRDTTKSAIVFGIGFTVLLILSSCSFITVAAYMGLAALGGVNMLRIYRSVAPNGNARAVDVYIGTELTEAHLRKYLRAVLPHLNALISKLRHLYLGDDSALTLKYVVTLWLMTFVGSFFNATTLLLVAFICLFSVPKLYEVHQLYFDSQLALVKFKMGGLYRVYYRLFGAQLAIADATEQESEF